MHDSKTRRRRRLRPPRSPQRPKYPPQTTLHVELPLSPCSLWMALPPSPPPPAPGSHPVWLAPRRYRSARRRRRRCVSSSPALPPSKSPLFIANGFRIMMPWVAAGPYSNTSCFLVRANLVPSPPARFPSKLLAGARAPFRRSPAPARGVVIAGGVIALARDLSNNLLCAIPPRHTPRPPSPSPSGLISSPLLPSSSFSSFSLSFFVGVIEDRGHSAGR